jgi:hypothetical protein
LEANIIGEVHWTVVDEEVLHGFLLPKVHVPEVNSVLLFAILVNHKNEVFDTRGTNIDGF